MSEWKQWTCPCCGGHDYDELALNKRRCRHCGAVLEREPRQPVAPLPFYPYVPPPPAVPWPQIEPWNPWRPSTTPQAPPAVYTGTTDDIRARWAA